MFVKNVILEWRFELVFNLLKVPQRRKFSQINERELADFSSFQKFERYELDEKLRNLFEFIRELNRI